MASHHSSDQSPTVTPSSLKDGFPFWERTLVVALPAIIMIVANVLEVVKVYGMDPRELEEIVESNFLGWHFYWTDILWVAAPLVSGGWVGIRQRGKHLKTYALLGLLVGAVAAMGMLFFDAATAASSISSEALFDFVVRLLFGFVGLYIVISTTLFVSGGLFGDLIARWQTHSIVEEATVTREITKLIVSPDSQAFEKVIKLLTVLYPSTLLFAGTLLTITLGGK